MEYFIKEWYEEGQIRSFLTFPETEKEWEDNIAWYETSKFPSEELRKMADQWLLEFDERAQEKKIAYQCRYNSNEDFRN